MKVYILKRSGMSMYVEIIGIFKYKSQANKIRKQRDLPYKNWSIKPRFFIETMDINTLK